MLFRSDTQDTFLLNPEETLDPTQETIILEETSKDLKKDQEGQFSGLPPGDRSSTSEAEWSTSLSTNPKKGDKPKKKKKKKKSKKANSDGGSQKKKPQGGREKNGESDANTRLTRSQANKKGIKLDKDGKQTKDGSGQATSTPIHDKRREAFDKFHSECLRAAREAKKAEKVSADRKAVSNTLHSLSKVSMELGIAFEDISKRVVFEEERETLKGRYDIEMIAVHQQMRRLKGFVEQLRIESAPSVASTPADIRDLMPSKPNKLDLCALRKPSLGNPTKSTEYKPVDILKEKLEREAAETLKREAAALAATKRKRDELLKKDHTEENKNKPQISNETFNPDENQDITTTDSQHHSGRSRGRGRGRGSHSSSRGRGQAHNNSRDGAPPPGSGSLSQTGRSASALPSQQQAFEQHEGGHVAFEDDEGHGRSSSSNRDRSGNYRQPDEDEESAFYLSLPTPWNAVPTTYERTSHLMKAAESVIKFEGTEDRKSVV